MTQPAELQYTLEQYIELEETADYKSEYIYGKIYAMAGGTYKHGVVIGNTIFALRLALRGKPCRVNNEVLIAVESNKIYTYPDVMVICSEAKFDSKNPNAVNNPELIVEVLSPSTRNYDRETKFERYKALASFQDYLLVEQDMIKVDHWHKLGDSWVLKTYTDINGIINLETFRSTLKVKRLYHRVQL